MKFQREVKVPLSYKTLHLDPSRVLLDEIMMRMGPRWVDYVKDGIRADINGYYREDRSRLDMALVNRMVSAGFDDSEIYGVLTDPEYGISDKTLEYKDVYYRERYVTRMLNRVRQTVPDEVQ